MEQDAAGARSLSFICFKVSVAITVPDHCDLEELALFLPPDRRIPTEGDIDRSYSVVCTESDGEDAGPRYQLFLHGRMLNESTELLEILAAWESDLSIAIATDARHGYIFVHAGVVSIGGRGLVFPGESRSGKSTLLRALLERGATYYSDEFAVFDDTGRVHPYARNPSFRGADRWAIGRKVAVESFGRCIGAGPLVVDGILGCHFDSESGWGCPVVSPGRGAMLLLENAVAAQLYPERTLRVLSKVAGGCVVREGTRGEAGDAVGEILRSFNYELEARSAEESGV